MYTLVIDLAALLYPSPNHGTLKIEWELNLALDDFIEELHQKIKIRHKKQKQKVQIVLVADVKEGEMVHLPMTDKHMTPLSLQQLKQEISNRLQQSTDIPHLRHCCSLKITPLRSLQKSSEQAMIFLTTSRENANYFEGATLGRAIYFDLNYPLMHADQCTVLQALQNSPGLRKIYLDLDATMHPTVRAFLEPHLTHINMHLVTFCNEAKKASPFQAHFQICTARSDDFTMIQRRLFKICKGHLSALNFSDPLPLKLYETVEKKCFFEYTPDLIALQQHVKIFYENWKSEIQTLAKTFKPQSDVNEILKDIDDKLADLEESVRILMGLYSAHSICDMFAKAADIHLPPQAGIYTKNLVVKSQEILKACLACPAAERPKIVVLIDDDDDNLDACEDLEMEFAKHGITLLWIKVICPGEYDPELIKQAIKYIRQTSSVELSSYKKQRLLASEPDDSSSTPTATPQKQLKV